MGKETVLHKPWAIKRFLSRGRACHHPARGCARVLPTPDHSRPVYPDIADARRELVRVFERGPIADSLSIEDDHIGVTARTEEPTIVQAKPRCDGAAHFA